MAGPSRPKDGVLSHAYVPAIHVFEIVKTWMPGMKPGMTAERTKRGHDGRFAPTSAGVTIPLVQNVERGRCQNKRSHAGERDGR